MKMSRTDEIEWMTAILCHPTDDYDPDKPLSAMGQTPNETGVYLFERGGQTNFPIGLMKSEFHALKRVDGPLKGQSGRVIAQRLASSDEVYRTVRVFAEKTNEMLLASVIKQFGERNLEGGCEIVKLRRYRCIVHFGPLYLKRLRQTMQCHHCDLTRREATMATTTTTTNGNKKRQRFYSSKVIK
jgi:hypothetical protein